MDVFTSRLRPLVLHLIVLMSVLFCVPQAYSETKDTEKINALIRELRNNDPDVRWKAVDALKETGSAAVGPLIEAMKDTDPDVHRMLVDILKSIGNPAVGPLIASLKHSSSSVRVGAVEILGKTEDARAIEALIVSLRDESADVREKAMKAMMKIRDRRAVEPLIVSLKDGSTDIRRVSAEVLLQIKDPRAVEPLIDLLSDKSADVRRVAAEALWQMRNEPQVKNVMEVMKNLIQIYRTYKGIPRRAAKMSQEKYRDMEYFNDNIKLIYKTYSLFILGAQLDSEPILVAAFDRYGDRQMASDFLNCGNQQLMQEAFNWARDNYYELSTASVSSGPRWGRK
ncbi:MAG: HEAT repeat domain-containing protein [Nitrospirae bacterium]|nr:HEAT repeat domain-containing protein [Nitrospirota bacterium]